MFKQTLNKRIHVSLPIAIIIILAVISIGISFIILLWSKYTGHYNAEIKAELSEIKAAAQEYNSENDSYIGFTTDLIPPKCSDKSYAIQISPDGDNYVSYARLCWSNTRLLQGKRDAFWCVDSNGFFGELEITNIPKDVYSCLLKKEPTSPKDETADWNIYRNEEYGFEIKYPPNWIITNDTLPKTPKNTVARENLEIANNLVPELPKLILWANPLGWSSTPFDIKYELSPTEENGIKVITRTEIPQYEESEEGSNIDGQVVIFCKTVKLGANTYTFSFIFKEEGKDYEPIFNQMLSTFRFLE